MVAAFLFACAAGAQQVTEELATEPVLRIETGRHVAAIRGIDVDAKKRFAVTAADDKTARVWSLADGKLQSILHLPIGFGDNGKAKAVAISPDGRTIAVGGYTGTAEHYNILLFDRETSALTQRLSDLPDVIYDLAYSPDGKRLAASLGSDGIRVFDVGLGYHLLPSDTKYTKASRSVMFDSSGRLVTASYDGFIRLYQTNQYETPIAKTNIQCDEPFRAAFSKDGTRVAAGCDNTIKVVVLSGANLKQLFEADTRGINAALAVVRWSRDGSLFAGGSAQLNVGQKWMNVVRCWKNGGEGAFSDIQIGDDELDPIRRTTRG